MFFVLFKHEDVEFKKTSTYTFTQIRIKINYDVYRHL